VRKEFYASFLGFITVILLGVLATAMAQTTAPPASTKVDGTDNVYIFRYGRHQSMFVVTPEGVIATDPIGLQRPGLQPPGACHHVALKRRSRTTLRLPLHCVPSVFTQLRVHCL
jgi:hypothetical protein